ncbi:hypothetical protein [Streptomyces albireticuli]|uniref:Uncharacterized protein n=1 Tax=Streptomyces albireticuli TaxID=1940 RepID=A0A2A2D5V9_9ACTN|nr:hypothetical protein [Streptomyces albireticuli]MCD9193445.1 hypothetical protein [Streptomyces albireticuli]PAU47868.1 hypothetical protein CK936_16290 [Streptomyces albireticuli]
MEPGDRRPTRTTLLKVAVAALGTVFFLIALTLPAPWAYAVGTALLAVSVALDHRPRHRR